MTIADTALEDVCRRLFVSIEGLPGRWVATSRTRELPKRVAVDASGAIVATYEGGRTASFRSVGFFAIDHDLKSPPEKATPADLRRWLAKHWRARLRLDARNGAAR